MLVEWKSYDRDNKKATTPPPYEMVWIHDRYEHGVTLGYFDDFTFRAAGGSDDTSVSHWAPIEYPDAPEGADLDDDDDDL